MCIGGELDIGNVHVENSTHALLVGKCELTARVSLTAHLNVPRVRVPAPVLGSTLAGELIRVASAPTLGVMRLISPAKKKTVLFFQAL